MRATLNALTAELRRLQSTGVKTVSVGEDSMAALRALVAAQPAPSPSAYSSTPTSDPAQAATPPVRSELRQPRAATPKPVELQLPPPPTVDLPAGDKTARWAALVSLVKANAVCREQLAPGKQLVVGIGNLDARVFFCGEAPGAEEEEQGEPFVGPAGQLLTKMIGAMGLQRSEVYIGNIMNWRPQLPTIDGQPQIGNRAPTAEEMAFCLPFLKAQIEIVQPEVIVALGATAARGLLGDASFKALHEIRGKWNQFGSTPTMVTYHPSYILRNQSNRSKRMIWEDLLQVMEQVKIPISEKQRGFFLAR